MEAGQTHIGFWKDHVQCVLSSFGPCTREGHLHTRRSLVHTFRHAQARTCIFGCGSLFNCYCLSYDTHAHARTAKRAHTKKTHAPTAVRCLSQGENACVHMEKVWSPVHRKRILYRLFCIRNTFRPLRHTSGRSPSKHDSVSCQFLCCSDRRSSRTTCTGSQSYKRWFASLL